MARPRPTILSAKPKTLGKLSVAKSLQIECSDQSDGFFS